MSKVLLKSIILLVLLVSSIFTINFVPNVYAVNPVTATATTTNGKTTIEVTNDLTSNSNLVTFILEIKNGEFKSFKLDNGWVGKKNSQTSVAFATTNPVKPGKTSTFEIGTDQSSPSFSWRALDANNNELGSGEIGGTIINENNNQQQSNQGNNQHPNQENNQQSTPRAVLDTSTFRIIPSQPSPGYHVRIVGQSFSASSNIDLYVNNAKISTLSSNDKGNFVATAQLPNNLQPGSTTFVIKDQQGNTKTFTTNIRTAPQTHDLIQNVPLTMNVDPIYHRGDSKLITGTATPGTTLTFSLSDPNGKAITTFSTKVNNTGTYSISNTVPIDRDFGKYTINVSDGKNQLSKQYSVVSTHQIALVSAKTKYNPGDMVMVNGTSISNQLVSFVLSDPANHQIYSKDVNVTSSGTLSFTYQLEDSAMKGTYTLTATQGNDQVPLYFGVGEDPTAPLSIRLDKLTYINTDKPIVNIAGTPSSTLNLVIIDPSDKEKFADTVTLGSDGLATYSFNLTSYTPGVYSIVLTGSTSSKAVQSFAIGLTTNSGQINLSLVKDTYVPGDSIIILGTANANSILNLSLVDPSGVPVKTIQTFTDKSGHFSSFDFRIPATATPGTWTVDATSGLNHKSVNITVKSATQGITVRLDRDSGLYTRGDLVQITGSDAGATSTVIIKILGANSTEITRMQVTTTNRGDYSVEWKIPPTFDIGSFTVQASSSKGTASVNIRIQ
ncbi:MAG: hypothetical protein ABI340_06745 [Nitrososphaera sp.]|jgi:uncharacterized protein YfaS (alpha-2-macroglobulin family)